VFTVLQADYVSAVREIGAIDTRIKIQHVLPNIAFVLPITFSIGIGAYILFEATISFLDAGPRGVVPSGK
jgi:ABC-type dipeptide/oligopeptide/nickel transport system permease subunit